MLTAEHVFVCLICFSLNLKTGIQIQNQINVFLKNVGKGAGEEAMLRTGMHVCVHEMGWEQWFAAGALD